MITESKLQEIYEAVKTPYKYGAVIKCDGVLNDSPVVFRDGDKWYMSYIEIDAACKTGYRTVKHYIQLQAIFSIKLVCTFNNTVLNTITFKNYYRKNFALFNL